MKMRKRLGAIVTAIAMILSFGAVPAFAADPPTGSLTMQDLSGKIKDTSSYSAYQIATFDVSSRNNETVFVNMRLNPANRDTYRTAIIGALQSAAGLTDKSADSEIFTAISGLKDDAGPIKAMADALTSAVAQKTADYTTQNGYFDKLPYGYYLVLETANGADDGTVISRPILVCVPNPDTNPATSDVKVKVKPSKAGIEKKIIEKDAAGSVILVDTSTAAVGETVSYQSLSTFPAYAKDAQGITYYVTDTFSKGLDFNPDSILKSGGAVTVVDDRDPKNVTIKATLKPNADYKLETSGIGSATFRLTLRSSNPISEWGNAGYKLRVAYSAKLNKDAKTGSTGNPNSVKLTYSTKPGDGCAVYTTPEDTVITYTYRLVVTKKDGSGVLLPGATFELHDSAGTTVDTQTTGKNGIATFAKLEQGTYSLVETKAPDGYNLLSEPIKFTISAANSDKTTIPNVNFPVTAIGNDAAAKSVLATWNLTLTSGNCTFSQDDAELKADIVNTSGFILPGTGGIGTTIFTVSGIAILLLGGCMALLYYKKKKKSERQ